FIHPALCAHPGSAVFERRHSAGCGGLRSGMDRRREARGRPALLAQGPALNKLLQDIVVKSQSMLAHRVPFVPGWDCHGLPIEFKVVKESRGLSPLEVRQRSEQYARKYIEIQRNQFRRLGVFGDWENPYLTLDPAYETVILQVFADIVEKGLVYQSKKPVYWSTGAQTALAEAEVEYKERRDPSIYVQFALT